jgi:hypothetical protein
MGFGVCLACCLCARGGGVYDVPGYGRLNFVGVMGALLLVEDVVHRNHLGHALCDNLRKGSWLLDYTASHMDKQVPAMAPARAVAPCASSPRLGALAEGVRPVGRWHVCCARPPASPTRSLSASGR